MNGPELELMAIPPAGTLAPVGLGASLPCVTEPSAIFAVWITDVPNEAVVIEPGATEAAEAADTAKGTVRSCCRGRISLALPIGVPLLETTVTPRNRFALVNASERSVT